MKSQKAFSSLSLGEVEQLEQLCSRLAQAGDGDERCIESLLEEVSGESRQYFVWELLWRDIEQRRRKGESPKPEDYLFTNDSDSQIVHDVFSEMEKDRAFTALTESALGVNLQELPPRYQKLEEIGRGGIGSVWRVFDRQSSRPPGRENVA